MVRIVKTPTGRTVGVTYPKTVEKPKKDKEKTDKKN